MIYFIFIFFLPVLLRSTFMYEQFPELMNMLWTRMLKDNKKNWRRVYKVGLSALRQPRPPPPWVLWNSS